MILDITTTATLRPELYERSLASVVKHIHGCDFRLIINIDPAGPGKTADVEAVAKKYIDNVIVYKPDTPDFQMAQLRCWTTVQTRYFWNIEDDWEILVDVDADAMVAELERDDNLALLRLPRWSSGEFCRQWDKRQIPFNGRYFEIPEVSKGNLAFSGQPSLIRADFFLVMLPYVNPEYDIEKQMKKHGKFGRYLHEWTYGVWQRPNEPEAILDIGTPWRKKHKIGKDGTTKHKWHTWRSLE